MQLPQDDDMRPVRQRPYLLWATWLGQAAIIVLGIVLIAGVSLSGTDKTSLANSETDSTAPTSTVDAKYRALTEEAAARAILLLTPSPGPGTEKPTLDTTQVTQLTTVAGKPAGAGIMMAGQGGPFSHMGYAFTTSEWIERKPETTIEVLAGASRNPYDWLDLGVGVVFVMETGPQGTHGAVYEAATKGELRFIVDAVGERLILQTQSGKALYFDVPARRFVDGLTVTALPAPTGYPTTSAMAGP